MPPAGLKESKVQNRFQNKKSWKVATGYRPFRNCGFAIGVALEGGPKLACAIHGRRGTENEDAIRAILLETFEVVRCKVTIEPCQRPTRNKDGVRIADHQRNPRGEALRRRWREWAVLVAGKSAAGICAVGAGFSRRASTKVDIYRGGRGSGRRCGV